MSQVAAGKLLKRRFDGMEVQPLESYKRVTIRMYGGGISVRDEVLGAEINTKKQFYVYKGQFLLSKIDARNGAFGIVPDECDGAIITGNFWTFDVNHELLDIAYLNYFTRTSLFVDFCIGASEGTTNRKYLREDKFLAQTIPLPLLDEQRRIVAHIETLVARIAEARGLGQDAVEEANSLFAATLNSLWKLEETWDSATIGELATTISGQVDPQTEPYASLPHINGEAIESGTCQLLEYRTAQEDEITSGKYHFPPGSILYSKIRPYLKKAVYVPFEGICSADIYAFADFAPQLEPRFFMYSLVSPRFTEYANKLSGRTRMPKLNQSQLFAFNLRYPHIDEQRRIVAYLDNFRTRVASLRKMQAQTAAELDALLPSVLDRAFRGEL